jgi:hypothetical protein
MNRRSMLSTSSLVLPALALAACSTATGTAPTNAVVQTVFNGIQFVLPLLDVLAAGIAVAVPAAAPIVATIAPYLASASGVFQTLSIGATEAAAQPVVAQIETYISAAVTAVEGVVNGNPKLAPLAPKVQQAQAVLGLLTAFINGVTATSAAAARASFVLPPLLHR